MKTICFLVVTAGLLAASSIHAQDADTSVSDGSDGTVVYSAPVVYQAPVVYTAPVVYQAPVYYTAPAPAPVCFTYPQPVSTVTYIGSGHVYTRNYYARCNSASQVIYFGSGQASQQGYQFR